MIVIFVLLVMIGCLKMLALLALVLVIGVIFVTGPGYGGHPSFEEVVTARRMGSCQGVLFCRLFPPVRGCQRVGGKFSGSVSDRSCRFTTSGD